MKTIPKSSLIMEDKRKLLQELNVLKNLDHPNIMRIYEVFNDNKNYYLILEYYILNINA